MLVEGRHRSESVARDGALVGVYRQLGRYAKVGVGYNFANYSDNVTDMSYRSQGAFINIVGKM